MSIYVDTSALIKKYVKESGSDELLTYWNATEIIVVSGVAYAEFFAAINRKYREGALSPLDYASAVKTFKDDWDVLVHIDVTDLLHKKVEDLTSKYPLRGFDAIHLVSALLVHELEGSLLRFLCADHRLNDAVRNEHLTVIDLS